jgi:hypothetical protein
MSYFNQPDHELIDRRSDDAKDVLLRLARSTTSGLDAPPVSRRSTQASASRTADATLTRWIELARARELPEADAEPVALGEAQVPLVWRAHYVAVTLDDSLASLTSPLEDKGFEVIAFGSDEATWAEPFQRLAKALGHAS